MDTTSIILAILSTILIVAVGVMLMGKVWKSKTDTVAEEKPKLKPKPNTKPTEPRVQAGNTEPTEADKVRFIRLETACGVMGAKMALRNNDGDVDKAIESIRKRGR